MVHRHGIEYLSGEVLKDSCGVDGSGGTDTTLGAGALLKVPVDTSDGELLDIVSNSGMHMTGHRGVVGLHVGREWRERWLGSWARERWCT